MDEETTQMKTVNRDSIRFFTSMITAICLLILIPLQTWILVTMVDHGQRIAVIENSQESFLMEGPRYTEKDAEKDHGIVLGLLERNGKQIDDHEIRIRDLESGQ